MRRALILVVMLAGLVTAATAQVNIRIGVPGVRIGINLPLFPNLVRVPNYPVYYAPELQSNYFFYDGLYWVFQDDTWYESSWYNGPWDAVDPEWVPLFILRIPVTYYRSPPRYFSGWRNDAPPHWGEHWGNEWQRQHSDWDRWDRASAPPPAPLPAYQRRYTQDRYPRAEQQAQLHRQNYQYRPRDPVVLQHFQSQGSQRTTAPGRPEPRATAPGQQSSPQRNREQTSPPARQRSPQDGQGEHEGQQQRQPPAAPQQGQRSPAPREEDATPRDRGDREGQQRQPSTERDRDNDERDRGNSGRDRGNSGRDRGNSDPPGRNDRN